MNCFRMVALTMVVGLSAIVTPGAVAQAKEAAGEVWTAHWIQAPWSTEGDGAELDGSKPMPVFRREFTVRQSPVKATLRIAGLGQYDARLNGKAVAPAGLHQAWTNYRKTVTYDAYDVTRSLKVGPNVLGVMLGNGMYNVQKTKGRYTKLEASFGAPKLIAELRVQYADGKTETIPTGAGWKVGPGPVTFSSVYGGEDFDARKVAAEWDAEGFDDAAWTQVVMVDSPGGAMIPAIAPDVRVIQTFSAPKSVPLGRDKVVYDFGQNFAGWPKVRVTGPAGAVLKLTPGELLKPDGSVSQGSSGGPMWWTYTLRGDSAGEEWAPQFGYYGFRYLQAEWSNAGATEGKATAKVVAIAGEELSSASPVVGNFESSNELLNAIHKLIVNAAHNNEVSLFTDCPHREKLGWLEETHLVAAGLMFNNDLHGMYAATERNIADAQAADGRVWTIAPRYAVFGTTEKPNVFDDSPEWGSASVLGPWAAYRFYGDVRELERSYPVMQAYVKYLGSRADADGIVAYGLGDWYDIGPKPPGVSQDTSLGVTGTLMLYEDAVAMRKIANLLGHGEDAARYATLAAREAAGFNRKYWDAEKGYYDTGSQTANAMPLALGIVPEERRAGVLAHIVADIHAHDDHITTGEVGYPYLLRALTKAGHTDVVMAMMLRKDPPSYGSQLAAGATALTEAWDANPRSSQDHFMLGGAEEWFYRGLAGIDFDMSRSKDERITIRPQVVSGVDWVKCGYQSQLGKIESDWKTDGEKTYVNVTVPEGATATVVLPLRFGKGSLVTIGNRNAALVPGVTDVTRDAKTAKYRVRAGTYHFAVASCSCELRCQQWMRCV